MLIHTAYDRNLRIQADSAHWIFDQCVFFIRRPRMDDADAIEAAYSQGDAKHVFELCAEGELIDVSYLILDEEAAAEISSRWGDEDDWGRKINAEALLDASDASAEDSIEDGGWHIQRIRAQSARRQGYLGVIDTDEQGEVIIIDFKGRNDELNAAWRYIGNKE